ncbi:MAG: TolC family protein [Elusimicrobia bacterium]|jgi:outer membrane protein TolC|nr:TolC family protein [Elusimicrobiota bacterium]
MKKNLLIVIILLSFSFSESYADKLSWDDIFTEALKKNPEIQNARSSLRLSEISYKSSLLNFYPDFSGNMGVSKSDSGNTSYRMGLSGSLSLFKGFKNYYDLKIKKTSLSIQNAVYKRTLADFVYNLRMSFAVMLKTDLTMELLEGIEDRRKSNMEIVKLRYDAGREDKGAYLRSEADYVQAKYETRSQKRNYRIVQAELLKNIGKDIYEVINVTGTFDIPEIETKPSKELLQNNPDYIMAKYRLEGAGYQLKHAYGDFYPSIGLSGSVSRSGNKWFPEGSSWGAGLSLSYPFFSGGRDFYNLKSAKLNKLISENSLKNMEHEIMLKIEIAYNDLIDAIAFYKVRQKFYAARTTRSEISRVKYISGLMSYQEWDSIENEFINAQKSLLDARYNVFAAWAKWLKVIGTSVFRRENAH